MKRTTTLLARLTAALTLALTTAVGAAADDLADSVNLDIAAQPLEAALLEFSKQTGLQLVVPTGSLPAHTTRPVTGNMPLQAALNLLLSDTNLTYKLVGNRTITIVPPKNPLSANYDDAAAIPLQAAASKAGVRLAQAGSEQNKNGIPQQTKAATEQSVQEVLVTATKRTERLQDVPASIAVLTAEDIERRGLVHAEDYLRGIPGASQSYAYGGQAVVIRGIETAVYAQGFGAGTTTATYFGETPTTGTGGFHGGSNVDIKLVDIQRVEVLRGPQGTAFGSSSLGGAVRTIPVAPKLDRFEGRLGAGYSMTSGTGGENYMFQGVGNIPLIAGKLAIRGAAYAFSDSGYYRNRAGSDPTFQANVVAPLNVSSLATDEDEVGAYYASGGRISALFQATDDLRFTLTYLSQKNQTDGWPLQNIGEYEQAVLRVAPEFVHRGQNGGYYDTTIDLANGVAEYDLQWADLLATYSYVKSEASLALPYTIFGQPKQSLSFGSTTPHREYVGEIRLATKLSGAWNFLAGIYGEKIKRDIDERYIWDGNLAQSLVPGVRFLGVVADDDDLEQKAAFGEVSWQFLPRFTLTGGIRAYKYDRSVFTDRTGPLFGAGVVLRRGIDASGTNLRANLSYKPSDNALVYAGWAEGFRLGKPQGGANPAQCDLDGNGVIDGTNMTIEQSQFVDSDSVGSYELGAKFATPNRRLSVDAAVFRVEWSGIPVSFRPPCLSIFTANAGVARSDGVEFQASFRPTAPVRIDFGGSYINARLTEDAPGIGAFAGNRLPGSPKVNANLGLQYEFDIGGRNASLRADTIYVSSLFISLPGRPTTEAGDYVKLDLSGRIALERINVDLYVRNVTNEDAFTSRSNFRPETLIGYRLRPRTVGMQLVYDF